MKRKSPIKRSTTPIRRSRVKPNAKRKAKRLKRTHGTVARREWMRTLPCAACGVVGYSEAAHLRKSDGGTKGTGYKGGADETLPLCGPRPIFNPVNGEWYYKGCHTSYDGDAHDAFLRTFHLSPAQVARDTHAAWLPFSRGSADAR